MLSSLEDFLDNQNIYLHLFVHASMKNLFLLLQVTTLGVDVCTAATKSENRE